MAFDITQPIKEMTVSYQITRADGTVEEQQLFGYYHVNPLKRFWHNKILRHGTAARVEIKE
jgi:hypothetical protein